jgi:hypothetical protein
LTASLIATLRAWWRGDYERTAHHVDEEMLERWRLIEEGAKRLADYDAFLERRRPPEGNGEPCP